MSLPWIRKLFNEPTELREICIKKVVNNFDIFSKQSFLELGFVVTKSKKHGGNLFKMYRGIFSS